MLCLLWYPAALVLLYWLPSTRFFSRLCAAEFTVGLGRPGWIPPPFAARFGSVICYLRLWLLFPWLDSGRAFEDRIYLLVLSMILCPVFYRFWASCPPNMLLLYSKLFARPFGLASSLPTCIEFLPAPTICCKCFCWRAPTFSRYRPVPPTPNTGTDF